MLNVFDALQGTASTKTRAEVRGGGKKPYAQKGTGNARQGSSRTPLRPGGGVVFGPKVCRAHHPACNILALDNSSASFLMCAKLLSWCFQTLVIPSLCFLCLTAQGLGYQNEQEGAQTGPGYSFPVCHRKHSHCGGLKGEKHCCSCCMRACKVLLWTVPSA